MKHATSGNTIDPGSTQKQGTIHSRLIFVRNLHQYVLQTKLGSEREVLPENLLNSVVSTFGWKEFLSSKNYLIKCWVKLRFRSRGILVLICTNI